MDGLGRAVGAPAHVRVNGKTYPIRVDMSVLGELENYLLGKQANPIEIAKQHLDGVPPEIAKAMMMEAVKLASQKAFIPVPELERFAMTREGVAVILWINMRQQEPGLELERVMAMVNELSEQDIELAKSAQNRAAGVDELGNSIGPGERRKKKKKKRRRGEQTGGNSNGHFLKNSASVPGSLEG